MSSPRHLISQKFTVITNSVSVPANVSAIDFRNIALSVIATALGGGTVFAVRVRGSLQKNPPDFTIASADGNEWSFIQLKDMSTNSYYDGATGFAITTAGTYALELNEDQLTWVAFEVFSRTSGQAVAQFIFKDNQ